VSRSIPMPSPANDRPFLTVEEAAAALGISRTLAYSLAREFLTTRAGLPCVRLGSRRIVVPRAALERWTNADLATPNDAA
jgi:excisionase family DNA binding protein